MRTVSEREARAWLDGALAALLALAVAWSYLTYARLPATRPSTADYERAAAHIRAHWMEGDLVDANPFWATRVREYLGDLPLEAFHDLEGEDLTRYRRVWLFSLFGAERRAGVQRALDASARLLEAQRFGRVDVRLYAVRSPAPVRYDFRQRLAEARVWIERGEERTPCAPREGGRWQCSDASWNYVGPETFELAREPRRVIWAHPVSGGVLTIDFESVTLGRALSLGAGFLPSALGRGAPVAFTVEVDGRLVARRFYGADAEFAQERIATPDLTPGPHRVTFKIATLDDRLRHFCFSVEARG
jgi:hypothetical protein